MKKTKIMSLKKIVKMAKKHKNKSLTTWDKRDLDGAWMEEVFQDFGEAIPLGKKGHLWVRARATVKNKKQAVLFFRKEVLDKAISKMDKNAIIQRHEDIKKGVYESSQCLAEDYHYLIDKHLFKNFTDYQKYRPNGYVNLYKYVLDKVFLHRGFYAEKKDGEIFFVSVSMDDEVIDVAYEMFFSENEDEVIEFYHNFNGRELEDEKFEALKELSINTYNKIDKKIGSKNRQKKFGITKRDMKLYKFIKGD